MAKNNNLGDFLKGLADKFREILYIEDPINPQDFEDKITEVQSESYERGYSDGGGAGYEQGRHEVYDTFWDNYQSSGNRTIYEFAFAREGWNNVTFKPKYDITVNLHDSANMFSYSRITGSLKTILNNCGVSLTFHNSGSTYGPRYMFVGTKFTELPELDFSQAHGAQALASTFSGSSLLQTIEKIILPDSCTGYGNYTFYNCRALQNINFEGTIKYSLDFKDCPLSPESFYNVKAHLDQEASDIDRTVTFRSDIRDKVLEYEQLDSGYWDWLVADVAQYGWTLALY